MECRPAHEWLVRLDAGRPDHLAPFLSFVSDEFAEVGGGTGEYSTTQVGEPSLDLRIGKSRVNLLVKLLDDCGGHVLGHAYAVPVASLVSRHKFSHGRDV